jgi:hypothetical protein
VAVGPYVYPGLDGSGHSGSVGVCLCVQALECQLGLRKSSPLAIKQYACETYRTPG